MMAFVSKYPENRLPGLTVFVDSDWMLYKQIAVVPRCLLVSIYGNKYKIIGIVYMSYTEHMLHII